MQFIEGNTLDKLMIAPWSIHDVTQFLNTLLANLRDLHNEGIVHRDLKPENIIKTPRGKYYLLDFGIAKQGSTTMTAAHAISLNYSPLEQLQGFSTDARSDLFSLAAAAYHLLTGQPPIRVDARAAHSITLTAPSALVANVPPVLENTLLHMLQLDIAQRPGSAQQTLDLLNGSGHSPTIKANPFAQPATPTAPVSSAGQVTQVNIPAPVISQQTVAVQSAATNATQVASTPKPSSLFGGDAPPPQAAAKPPAPVLPRKKSHRGRWVVAIVLGLGLIGLFQQYIKNTNSRNAANYATATRVAEQQEQTAVAESQATATRVAEQQEQTAVAVSQATATIVAAETSYNTLVEQASAENNVYPPSNGSLPHEEDDFIEVTRAVVLVQDFLVEATFYNPYGTNDGAWTYGFIFREATEGTEYHLTMSSDKQWHVILRTVDAQGESQSEYVASGTVSNLATGAGESNTVALSVSYNEAILVVNREVKVDPMSVLPQVP